MNGNLSYVYKKMKPEDICRFVQVLYMFNYLTTESYDELMQDFRKKWPNWEKENL